MALKLNYVKNFYGQDVTYNDAYMRINKFDGNKDIVGFEASIFTDSAKETEIEKLPRHYCPVDAEKPIIQQCYEYLKSREEYSEAVDC